MANFFAWFAHCFVLRDVFSAYFALIYIYYPNTMLHTLVYVCIVSYICIYIYIVTLTVIALR